MKVLIIAALSVTTLAAPERAILPLFPLSVIMSGGYQLLQDNKIVGGNEVAPNSLPFQVSFQLKSFGSYVHFCGGSILNETTILSAAHCFESPVNLAQLRVVAGEHNLFEASGYEQYRNVTSYIIHPKYNPETMENDISLIFLKSPLNLNVPSVKAINLPPPTSEYDPPAGTLVTVSGWGTTSYQSSAISPVLLGVNTSVVSDTDCKSAYSSKYVIFPSMLCAGALGIGGFDSCQGDSGGPLFIKKTNGDFVLHGIVSWGEGCAQPNYPGVYTQVSYYVDWITSNG